MSGGSLQWVERNHGTLDVPVLGDLFAVPNRVFELFAEASVSGCMVRRHVVDYIRGNVGFVDVCRPGEVGRIFLSSIQVARKPSVFIDLVWRAGLLDWFLPELKECNGVYSGGSDVFQHILRAMDMAPTRKVSVRLALMFHDIGKLECRSVRGASVSFTGHEQASCVVAKAWMDLFGLSEYSHDVLELVRLHEWREVKTCEASVHSDFRTALVDVWVGNGLASANVAKSMVEIAGVREIWGNV